MAIICWLLFYCIFAHIQYQEEINLIIEHTFKNSQPVYFALSVPFTYSQN